MISITERVDSKYPVERNYKVPPWISVPAVGGAAGIGAYQLTKKAGEKTVDVAKDIKDTGERAGKATGDWAARKTREAIETTKDAGRESGRRMGKAFDKLKKDFEAPWPFNENLETIISIGLLNEVKKMSTVQLKKRAGMKALSKGQPKLIRDPSDRIARAQVDGGNRLIFGAIGKKPPMRTVS